MIPHTHSPAHINEACYHAMRHALFPSAKREVRRDAKRFQRACAATAEALRSELASTNNIPLEEAVERTRETGR